MKNSPEPKPGASTNFATCVKLETTRVSLEPLSQNLKVFVKIRAAGFEPATCGSQNHRATKLRYALTKIFKENVKNKGLRHKEIVDEQTKPKEFRAKEGKQVKPRTQKSNKR